MAGGERTTRAARQLWEHAYHTPWPKGWKVCWRDDFPPSISNALGACLHHRKHIVLNWPLLKNHAAQVEPFNMLIHEFTHLRHPKLRHCPEFRRMIVIVYRRMIGDPEADWLFQQLRAAGAKLRRKRARARYQRLRARIRESQQEIQTTLKSGEM